MLVLERFGLGERRAQADGDVVGEVISAQGQHGGVHDASRGVDGDIRRATPNVHEHNAQLALVLTEHGLSRSEGLEHDVGHIQLGQIAAFDDILTGGSRTGDDMDVHLQPDAGHAQRVLHSVLIVDDEILGQDVQHLPVAGDADGLCRVDHPPDILLGNRAVVLHGHHAVAIDSLNVVSRDAYEHFLNRRAAHQLALPHRLLDGAHRLFDVDDDPLADSFGARLAEPHHIQLHSAVRLSRQGADFGRANIKSDYYMLPVAHSASLVGGFRS